MRTTNLTSQTLHWTGGVAAIVVAEVLGASALADDQSDPAVIIPIPCRYELTVIEGPNVPPLSTSTSAMDINECGQVTGSYKLGFSDESEAFLWTAETGLVTLQRPAGTIGATGLGINNAGQIVGQLSPSGAPWLGYIWTDGVWQTIPSIVPATGWSRVNAINEAGIAVGYRGTSGTPGGWPWTAFRYEAGVITDLGLVDGLATNALAINEAGLIVGHTAQYIFLPQARAFLWDGEDLTIFDPIPGGTASYAYGINDQDVIVGGGQVRASGSPNGINRGLTILDGATSPIMLTHQPLPGFLRLALADVNNDGAAVGTSWSSPGDPNTNEGVLVIGASTLPLEAFLPPIEGEYDLKWTYAINDQWQIVGDGGILSLKAFLLDPVWSIPGDLTCDGHVGAEDLASLLADWGATSSLADLNRDGLVDGTDLGLLLAEWG